MSKHEYKRSKGVTLPASIRKNDSLATILIVAVSLVVFVTVVVLGRVEIDVNLGFDKHIFARINALINTFVTLMLLGGLWAAKEKKFRTHKKVMLWAIGFSVMFLLSYICHHLFSGSTEYQGTGLPKMIYLFLLITHIVLAGIILPLILFTAYRALTGEYARHKKLAKYTWPIWLYVAVTGVIVYLMISPYYDKLMP